MIVFYGRELLRRIAQAYKGHTDHNGEHAQESRLPVRNIVTSLAIGISGFGDTGRVGVSSKYISHLMIFSQMVKLKHSFADVMEVAEQISPSLRYYLLLEYRRRNAGNIPRNVQEQCAAVSKEVRNVILFPKEAKGVVNQKKQG